MALATVLPATADEADEIDPRVRNLVSEAVERSPDVRRAVSTLASAREEIDVERGAYFPQVTANTRSEFNSSLNRNVAIASVNASQRLYDFGSVEGRVDRARAAMVREDASLEESVEEVIDEAVRTLLDLQRQTQLLEVGEEHVTALDDVLDLVSRRAREGAANRSDVRQVSARVSESRLLVDESRSRVAEAQRNLESILQRAVDPAQYIDATPVIAGACFDASTDFMRNLPALRAAEAREAEAEAQQLLTRGDSLPRLSVDARVDRFLDSGVDDQTETALFLNLSVDLYRGGSNQARRAGARFGRDAARAARESVVMASERRLNNAKTRAADLERRQELLDSVVADLIDTRELYRTQYVVAGSRSVLDLLNVEGELLRARENRVRIQLEQMELQVDCLASVGGLRSAYGISVSQIRGFDL